jgi:ADP-ribose pyrophosphatase YjhB (NUDIX family)
MEYCRYCGGRLTQQNDTVFKCDKCGKSSFNNPTPGVGIIFVRDNNLLMARRAIAPRKGELDFIGGFLDSTDNVERSLERELQEEVGITNKDYADLSYIGSFHEYYEYEGIKRPVVAICFCAQLKDGVELKPADDVASIAKLDIREIPYNEISATELRELLRNFATNFIKANNLN